jgi:hypothetical protein
VTRDRQAPLSQEVVVQQLVETVARRDRLLLLLDQRMTERIATLERTIRELRHRIDDLERGDAERSR